MSSSIDPVSFCLAPIEPPNAAVLILGSLPGRESLRLQQYYAHPRNQFWPILFDIFGEARTADYTARVALLYRHGVALWDTVGAARREGSLDSAIQNPVPNDIAGLLARHSGVERVLLNGGKAAEMYRRHNRDILLPAVALPSTSPIPGKNIKSYTEKFLLWKKALSGT